jgi:hypothetical protein
LQVFRATILHPTKVDVFTVDACKSVTSQLTVVCHTRDVGGIVQKLVQLASNDSTRRFFVLKHPSLHCLVGDVIVVIIVSHIVPACPCDAGYLSGIEPVPTPLAWLGFVSACHL